MVRNIWAKGRPAAIHGARVQPAIKTTGFQGTRLIGAGVWGGGAPAATSTRRSRRLFRGSGWWHCSVASTVRGWWIVPRAGQRKGCVRRRTTADWGRWPGNSNHDPHHALSHLATQHGAGKVVLNQHPSQAAGRPIWGIWAWQSPAQGHGCERARARSERHVCCFAHAFLTPGAGPDWIGRQAGRQAGRPGSRQTPPTPPTCHCHRSAQRGETRGEQGSRFVPETGTARRALGWVRARDRRNAMRLAGGRLRRRPCRPPGGQGRPRGREVRRQGVGALTQSPGRDLTPRPGRGRGR